MKETPASIEDVDVTEDGELDERYLSYTINEWDSSALEKATQLKEEYGGTISILSISSRENKKMLRKCLARGADEAILIQSEAFEKNDSQTSARILASVLKEMNLDMILTGLQSDDIGHSIVGGALAELLNFPFLPFVCSLNYDPDSETVTVRQLLEEGVEREIKAPTPAVLAVETRIADPKIPTMMAIRKTNEENIDIRTPKDFGFYENQIGEKGAKTKVRRYKKTLPPEATEVLEGSPKGTFKKGLR